MLVSFLFLHENICCGYALEAPRRGTSNEYPQHIYSSRNKKAIMWIPPLICSYVILVLFFSISNSGSGLGNVEPTSSVVSVSDSFSTFNPADIDMNMDARSSGTGIDIGDHMVSSLDENNSNISGPTSNISPRGQDVGYVNDIEVRTSFSVDVPPFKSNLDKVSFSQPDMGQVFSAGSENNQVYNSTQDIDGVFSSAADNGNAYSQVFSASDGSNDDYSQVFSSASETGHSYSQGFSSSSDTVHSYSQVFSSNQDSTSSYSQTFSNSDASLTYANNSDVSSGFTHPNINNIMDMKSPATEQTNICKVRLHALEYVHMCIVLLFSSVEFP